MKIITDLNISYRKLLVSPKDFVALTEIFDRSEIVDTSWTEKSGQHLVIQKRRMLSGEQACSEPITQEQFDALYAAEKAEKEKENVVAA